MHLQDRLALGGVSLSVEEEDLVTSQRGLSAICLKGRVKR